MADPLALARAKLLCAALKINAARPDEAALTIDASARKLISNARAVERDRCYCIARRFWYLGGRAIARKIWGY